MDVDLIDAAQELKWDMDGRLAILRTQDIPDDFLDHLASLRHASRELRKKETHHVASVPATVVDIWLRQGRDFYTASAREIVSWLRADGLDAFVTTTDSV